jgi:hypothetical protein
MNQKKGDCRWYLSPSKFFAWLEGLTSMNNSNDWAEYEGERDLLLNGLQTQPLDDTFIDVAYFMKVNRLMPEEDRV